ncbi:NAD(P)/FAD-dependent oxidoreductase [Nonomuraea sp. NPDC050022]|uniref:NAD(P)/FAD-dependent oxidoreductase n=1 Tax=Nonomuraea sp. NPDC050022 TaxID=3364358 RepID=UPI00378B4E11
MTRAVVLGGGFAGSLAGAVLARHADDVIVIENDHYPSVPRARRGLPQSQHSHVLVAGGARALQELLPGTLEELFARGAHHRRLPGDALILAAVGWFRRLDTGAYLISCSRGLLDQVVRKRALGAVSTWTGTRALAAVSTWTGTRALGLVGDARRVTGVSVSREGAAPETIEADLVVDATGRRSKAPRWLAELGGAEIEETTVSTGLAYSTRVYQAPAELTGEMPAIMLHPRPVAGRPGQGATLFPIEDGRWIVTLTGTRGGEPPADERGFADFARSLRDPIVADLMAAATPLGGIRPYRDTSNRRRYFERARLPAGFVAIGDAVVAVNPVHSHGMSVAALSTLRLDRELTRRGFDPAASAELQAAMMAEAESSWRMALAQDAGLAGRVAVAEGAGPAGRREATAFEREILARRTRALLSSPELAADFFRTQTLMPVRAEKDGSAVARALTGEPDPLLTTREAVMQYPALHAWWDALNRVRGGREPSLR